MLKSQANGWSCAGRHSNIALLRVKLGCMDEMGAAGVLNTSPASFNSATSFPARTNHSPLAGTGNEASISPVTSFLSPVFLSTNVVLKERFVAGSKSVRK